MSKRIPLWMRLLIVVALCGCQSKASPTRPLTPTISLSNVQEENEAEVLKQIPIGTPTADAEAGLRSIGFSCNRAVDKEGEFLWGTLRRPSGTFVEEKWMIKVRIKAAVVQSVTVNHGYVGL